jgi:hypothetical protein
VSNSFYKTIASVVEIVPKSKILLLLLKASHFANKLKLNYVPKDCVVVGNCK